LRIAPFGSPVMSRQSVLCRWGARSARGLKPAGRAESHVAVISTGACLKVSEGGGQETG
jgi:hypothetical protein